MEIIETKLCKLAYKYGTDKCPRIKHNYTPYYYDLLKDKKIKKVLEMGIGNYPDMKHVDSCYDPRLKRTYIRGASLKMWRDFFPEAMIYGADNLPETIFEDERIKTFLCDETKEEDIKNLIKQTGRDIDLFIDDGSHKANHQLYLARTILPLLDKNVIYIIEDVGRPDWLVANLPEYKCEVPRLTNYVPHTVKDRLLTIHIHHDDNVIRIRK